MLPLRHRRSDKPPILFSYPNRNAKFILCYARGGFGIFRHATKMFKKNSGSNKHDILQKQFTSYLSLAVSNARIDFIRAKIARLKREQATDQYELLFTQEVFEVELFLENEALSQAIRDIREKERYVFLARVLEDKKFKEIAKELGMGEKGVAAIYYRTVKKLRDILEGGE